MTLPFLSSEFTPSHRAERIAIAAVARNGVIGVNNAMAWHLPIDFQFFKHNTLTHPIIMGKNTYFSLGKALPQRENIVISQSIQQLPDALVLPDLTAAFTHTKSAKKVFIIGGGKVYQSALNQVDTLLITWVEATIAGDCYFPQIDAHDWRIVSKQSYAQDANHPYSLTFTRYERIKPLDV